MNKIVLLKAAVTVMTFLIFLGLGGVFYGLFFYKKPSRFARQTFEPAAAASPIALGLPEKSTIKDFKECGGNLCIHVQTNGKERIAIVSPLSQNTVSWIYLTEKPDEPQP